MNYVRVGWQGLLTAFVVLRWEQELEKFMTESSIRGLGEIGSSDLG
jgi:hypothetical protein